MKIMHTTIIISVVSLAVVMFAIYVIQPPPNSDSKTYQYEIHEPYDGVDKNFGTVIIQNKTFFVDNLNTFLHDSNSTTMEWYGIKFSFPHGSELVNTPGGSIFESYVTFSDDPVPYRIAIGQIESQNTMHDFTTVLSTHANPQVGFTLHNGTIQLLVNWPKVHSDISINGLNDTYYAYQPLNFQVEAKGFGYFDAGATPDIQIEKQNGTLVWTNLPHPIVLCCPADLKDYDAKFSTPRLGATPIINQTGTYKLVISYSDKKLEKQFSIIPSNSSRNFDVISVNGTDTGFSINYTITEGNKLSDAKFSSKFTALTLSLHTTRDGTLTVTIPKALLNAKNDKNQDLQFIILEDGQEITYKQIDSSILDRTLSIQFQNNTSKIEIIATQII